MDVYKQNSGRVFEAIIGGMCMFKCHYCYLDGANVSSYPVAVNADVHQIQRKMTQFAEETGDQLSTFNLGEHTDSLALDHLTRMTTDFIPFVTTLPNSQIELRTKSANVQNLKGLDHQGRTIVGFTLSPQLVIDNSEGENAVPFEDRIVAVRQCQEWGYPVSLKLDPVIPFAGWQDAYTELIDRLADTLNPKLVHHYAVGVLRWGTKNLKLCRKMFPDSGLWHFDYSDLRSKKRAPSEEERREMYHHVLPRMQAGFPEVEYYLSMEMEDFAEQIIREAGEIKVTDVKPTNRQTDTTQVQDQYDLAHEKPIITEALSSHKIGEDIEAFIASNPTWKDTFAQSIGELISPQYRKKPARLLAWIHQVSSPKLQTFQGMELGYREVMLRDQRGDRIPAIPMSSDRYEAVLGKFMNTDFPVQMVVLEGAVFPVVPVPADRRGRVPDPFFAFYITGVKDQPTAEDLIQVKPDPDETIAAIFREHARKPKGIVNYIKSQLVENLHIQGLDKLEGLDQALDFIIYQSFSDGYEKNSSMKLNSLVIGPPGAGKKLLTTAALILNPVGEEVASVDRKLTVAGLIGNKSTSSRGHEIRPGYVPRASHGVLCIQDFHEIRHDRQPIFAMFSKLMEDGEVIDSTTSRVIFKALTAIHVDMNRLSQVRPLPQGKQDIDVPVNVLSRFDFIVELERGGQSQLKVAEEILREWGKADVTSDSATAGEWKRTLKRIVAYVRTYFRKVEPLPENVRECLVGRMDAVWKEMQDEFPDEKAITDFSTRAAISAHKYVRAITSASLGTVATEEDVDGAIPFIKTKLRTVLQIRGEIPVVEKPKSLHDLRHEFIQRTFGGEVVTIKGVRAALKEAGIAVAVKTVERDLKTITERVAQGKYRVKKSDE